MKRFVPLLLCLLLTLVPQARASGPAPAGVDYLYPAAGLTGCPPWTWLTAPCYTDSTRTPSQASPHDLLRSDVAYLVANHLGTFTRVWISLDSLMQWDPVRGYLAYDPAALANLADAVDVFNAAGIHLDLVFYVFNAGPGGSAGNPGYTAQWQPAALDGLHGVLRTDYRTAVYDLLAYLSTTPGHSAVQVVDLCNECYYQLEQYYAVASHLGAWTSCRTANGSVALACIDQRVIAPWLRDLYSAAKAAWPGVQYTISDTGRLLTTDPATLAYWVSLYPVDLYDIHLYAADPAAGAARWATARALPKPWFAGEVGCAVGNVACTYDGTTALPVDSWWLTNLPADGARWVLVEDRRTAWTFPYDPSGPFHVHYMLSPVGAAIAARNGG